VKRRWVWLCFCAFILQASAAEKLLVGAAASLKKPLTEIFANEAITLNFASSGMLQQQIENGAPIDVFISAAPQQMDALEKKGLLVPRSRRDVLRNQLLLIARRGITLRSFEELAKPEFKRIVIGEPKSVPVGAYAEEIFHCLKLNDVLQPKLVFAADAQQVLAFVETGDADAGIAYATDARASTRVQIIAQAPPDSHSPAVYPVAIIKATKRHTEAEHFIDRLHSVEAVEIFQRHGFVVVQ
jgi:molybdate transport system substrate-binding protein